MSKTLDTIRQLPHVLDDLVLTHRSVHLAIHDPFWHARILDLEQAIQQKLNCVERFAVPANQAVGFLGIDLQSRIAALAPRLFDLHDKAEIAEHGIEQLSRIRAGLNVVAHQRVLPLRFAA